MTDRQAEILATHLGGGGDPADAAESRWLGDFLASTKVPIPARVDAFGMPWRAETIRAYFEKEGRG